MLLCAIVIGLPIADSLGDAVRLRSGLTYDPVAIVGVADGALTCRLRGRLVTKWLRDVASITLSDGAEFNRGEALLKAKKYAEAVAAYKASNKAAAQPWHGYLVNYRILVAADAAGDIEESTRRWIAIVEADRASPASLKLSPTKAGPAKGKANDNAIRLLEAKASAEGAKRAYVQAIKMLLVELYLKQGQGEKARKIASEVGGVEITPAAPPPPPKVKPPPPPKNLPPPKRIPSAIETAGKKVELLFAKAATSPPVDTGTLLEEAIAALRSVVAAHRPDTDGDQLAIIVLKMDLAIALSLDRSGIEFARCLVNAPSLADRKTVLDASASAIRELKRLNRRISELFREWDKDDQRVVTGALGRADALRQAARYRFAWMCYYRAKLLPDRSPERRELLSMSCSLCLSDEPDLGHKEDGLAWAILLRGLLANEVGVPKKALSYLRTVAGLKSSPAPARWLALNEIARIHGAGDDPDEADKATASARAILKAGGTQAAMFAQLASARLRGDTPERYLQRIRAGRPARPDTSSLTSIQQEEVLKAYEQKLAAWRKAALAGGSVSTWVVHVRDVASDPNTGGVLVRGQSDGGLTVIARFGASSRDALKKLRKGQTIAVKGKPEGVDPAAKNAFKYVAMGDCTVAPPPSDATQPKGPAGDMMTCPVLGGLKIWPSALLDPSFQSGVSFFGLGAGAPDHVVYVVDRSGSMLDTLEMVKHEMRRSIGQLNEEQSFHIIFYAKGEPKELPQKKLLKATMESKRAAAKYLRRVQAQGMTDPVPALLRAFAVLARAKGKGKVIYLLTDGEFSDNEKVLATIRKLNAGGKVSVNTILHHHQGQAAVDVLRKIASQNGGRFKFVEPR